YPRFSSAPSELPQIKWRRFLCIPEMEHEPNRLGFPALPDKQNAPRFRSARFVSYKEWKI
ncbi:MAG: hypothetical protein KAH99_03475, partial [Verrucomicrobia bacterium]|nr:hypothetical protein [Verrucomicrobiota bacterium]